MVTLPKEFVATKYPGYFWNIKDEKLYSIKVTGALKPLSYTRAGLFNKYTRRIIMPGYHVSVNGKKKILTLEELKALKPKKQIFPIYTTQMALL